MSFSSLFFVFLFLPLSVLLVYLAPARIKKVVLVAVSFVFYAWGGVLNLLVLLGSIVFNYLGGIELGYLIELRDRRKARLVLVTTVAANVALLAVFKYTSAGLPIGASFYTFSVLSYLFDVYQERTAAERNPLNLALYVSFFAKISSGPIEQYADMEPQIERLRISRGGLFLGGQRFLLGLIKKVLIADSLGTAFALATSGSEMATLTAWLGMIFYSLQLYFDFSSYSDMAIGLARIFGFEFKENFDYPYLSRSVSEFWRRWHISLGAWFRQYVYIPLGGNRVSSGRLFLNLLVVWLLTGIWHGSTMNFVVWGLWHGFFVILERFVIRDHFDRIPALIRILATDLVAFIGWVFFFSPNLSSAIAYIRKLFGGDGLGFADRASAYYLVSFLPLLIVAVIGCTKVVRNAVRAVIYRNALSLSEGLLKIIAVVVTLVLFMLAIAGMVQNSWSTFLYFQF